MRLTFGNRHLAPAPSRRSLPELLFLFGCQVLAAAGSSQSAQRDGGRILPSRHRQTVYDVYTVVYKGSIYPVRLMKTGTVLRQGNPSALPRSSNRKKLLDYMNSAVYSSPY